MSSNSATSSSSKPVTEVLATPGRGSDRPREIRYTDTKIIGNGSFGVVYQAVMVGENGGNDVIAIKKVTFLNYLKKNILIDLIGFTR